MKCFALPSLCALLLLATGCHYSNPHGSQELPPTKRLNTEPSGATLFVPRLNLQLETPCELPMSVDESEIVAISAEGYQTWSGRLMDLPQTAMKTYRCVLQK